MFESPVRYEPVRVLTVTLGLAIAGAAFGALTAAAGLFIALCLDPQRGLFVWSSLGELAASAGALVGAVAAPTVTWVMLRRVPFGRLFPLLTLGTIAGGVCGYFTLASIDLIFGPTLAAFAGFLATAIALSVRHDPTRRLANRS